MSKVVNFGCRLNNFEGKKIEELLVNNNENMVVINSCAVTNETERQVRQTIRRIKKECPDKKIVMTGCAAQISPDKYSSMTEVDKVIDNISKLKSETWTSLLDEELEVDFKEDIFDTPQDIQPSLDNKNLKEVGYNKSVKNLIIHQSKLAQKAKLDAIVCSPNEVNYVGKFFKKEIITPGVRFNKNKQDQKRTMHPSKIKSDWLVCGRILTKGNFKNNLKKLIQYLN